jgi:hypothetical protein
VGMKREEKHPKWRRRWCWADECFDLASAVTSRQDAWIPAKNRLCTDPPFPTSRGAVARTSHVPASLAPLGGAHSSTSPPIAYQRYPRLGVGANAGLDI